MIHIAYIIFVRHVGRLRSHMRTRVAGIRRASGPWRTAYMVPLTQVMFMGTLYAPVAIQKRGSGAATLPHRFRGLYSSYGMSVVLQHHWHCSMPGGVPK